MTVAVDWENSKKPVSGDKQLKEIVRTKFNEGANKRRLLGTLLPRYVYWIVTKDGKRKTIDCLSFDRKTQTMKDSLRDPIRDLPDDVFPSGRPVPNFGYVCNVINKDGPEGKEFIELHDLKATVYKEILELVKDEEYGNPADIDKGYDIIITKTKTGPLPQNVKYSVRPARNTRPLSAHERELELYDLEKIMKLPTYEDQMKWLAENTTYLDTDEGGEFRPEGREDLN